MTVYEVLKEKFGPASKDFVRDVGDNVKALALKLNIKYSKRELTETYLVNDYPESFRVEIEKIADEYMQKKNAPVEVVVPLTKVKAKVPVYSAKRKETA